MMYMPTRFWGISAPCALMAAFLCLAANSADAGTTIVVATDGFDDGNRTDVTDGINWYSASGFVDADMSGTIEPGEPVSPAFSVVDDSAGLGSGNALMMTPSTTREEIYGVFPNSVTIPPGIGSSMSVKFSMRATRPLDGSGNPQFGGGTIAWGIYQFDRDPSVDGYGISDGDYDVGDPVNDPSFGGGGDVGTYIQLNGDDGGFPHPDGAVDTNTGTSTRFFNEHNDASVPLFPYTTFNPNNLIIMAESDTDRLDYPAALNPGEGTFRDFPELTNERTTMEIIVERLTPNGSGEGDLKYTFKMTNPTTGTDMLMGVEPGPISHIITADGSTTDTYDYIIINQQASLPWLIDDFQVSTFQIPEPATMGLLGLGFAGLLLGWRRLR